MFDKKRKFLNFFEEIALLVESGQIAKDVANYMFGYYAIRALKGPNFLSGINAPQQHWALLYKFAADAASFSRNNPNGPPAGMTL